MTHHTDILGRAPVLMPMPEADFGPMRDDWRGEHLISLKAADADEEVDPAQERKAQQAKRELDKVEVARLFHAGASVLEMAQAVHRSEGEVRRILYYAELRLTDRDAKA